MAKKLAYFQFFLSSVLAFGSLDNFYQSKEYIDDLRESIKSNQNAQRELTWNNHIYTNDAIKYWSRSIVFAAFALSLASFGLKNLLEKEDNLEKKV